MFGPSYADVWLLYVSQLCFTLWKSIVLTVYLSVSYVFLVFYSINDILFYGCI